MEARIAEPDFWFDQNQAKATTQQYQSLKEEYETWRKLQAETDDLAELLKIFTAGGEAGEQEAEIRQKLELLEKTFRQLELSVLFAGEYDKNSAILSIHAGTGGVDAMDFAQMLLRMYLRFCERHKFLAVAVDETPGAEAGVKSVTIEVTGRFAYGWLKSEAGVHRLVRISPFDAEKMRHTSFALVEVLPELSDDEQKFELQDSDLKIDVFRAGGHGGQSVNTTDSAVRITHLPTGLQAKCQNERSQLQNKNTALKVLRAKLARFYQEQSALAKEKIKGEHRQVQWGNQARSYVLNPYRLVKDHRSGQETADTDRVFNGELDDFVEAFLRQAV